MLTTLGGRIAGVWGRDVGNHCRRRADGQATRLTERAGSGEWRLTGEGCPCGLVFDL